MTFPLACQPAAPAASPQTAPPAAPSVPAATPSPKLTAGPSGPITVTVPTSGYKLNFAPIPGDPAKGIDPLWMCTTEIVWDAFDVYVFKLDVPEDQRGGSGGGDAKTHPSKPYLPPDRGFGHAGFATISVTYRAAEGFCAWLSDKAKMHFRLATEDEWEHAAAAGQPATPGGATYGIEGGLDKLPDYAWFKDNAGAQPHAVAQKQPNAWGLFDMHGNVSEWVKGRDGKPAVKGGSYLDPAENLATAWRSPQQSAWNMSDPQVPKSRWWLSDAPFVGFRIVCDPKPRPDAPATPAK